MYNVIEGDLVYALKLNITLYIKIFHNNINQMQVTMARSTLHKITVTLYSPFQGVLLLLHASCAKVGVCRCAIYYFVIINFVNNCKK